MTAGALVSIGSQLVGDQFAVGHPISITSANLSGMTIGGPFMVMGFIRDGRIEEERKRTEEERKRAQDKRKRANAAEARAEAAGARVDRERERSEAAEARAERLMDRYEAATEALIRRSE